MLIVAAFVFFALIVGLIIWAVRAAIARAKRIRAAFLALAQAQGLAFLEADPGDRPNRYLGFAPFGQGHGRCANNVLYGTRDGVAVELFTYRYTVTTGSGKNRSDHTYFTSVAAIAMPASAPNLAISKETLGKKIFDALGGQDIDFESDEFSRKFWIKCDDRKFAYDVITPRMMEWLEPFAESHHAWQWRGGILLVTVPGVLRPEEAMNLLSYAEGFRQKVPPMVARGSRTLDSGHGLRAA